MSTYRARITYNRRIRPNVFRMGLEAEGIAREAMPGQFYMIHNEAGRPPILPRPFAMFRKTAGSAGSTGRPGDGLEILVRIVGTGTQMLSEKRPGDTLTVRGPLGNGWPVDSEPTPILVAGGIGVASLTAYAESLSDRERKRTVLYLGARTADELWCVEEFEGLGIDVRTAVEWGDHPFKGTVLNLLDNEWGPGEERRPLYICGPPMMVKNVVLWGQDRGLPCRVSLESRMACGVGLCLGCAVKEAGTDGYLKVCKDGPVFQAERIDWQAFDEYTAS